MRPFSGYLAAGESVVPPFRPVPTAKWLLSIYAADVLTRLDDIKKQIKSTFGDILKLDSTKRVRKKLSGAAAGTAAWATNVGNEDGQVRFCPHITLLIDTYR